MMRYNDGMEYDGVLNDKEAQKAAGMVFVGWLLSFVGFAFGASSIVDIVAVVLTLTSIVLVVWGTIKGYQTIKMIKLGKAKGKGLAWFAFILGIVVIVGNIFVVVVTL